jgi:uncharacterized protein YndB with AHSA1/START domain
MSGKSKPNEIRILRRYDAPVKMVWEAWVDPEQVGKWWGPRGFTLTTKSKDVRAGGKWVYTMHGPDGVDYPNVTLFHEVEKYSRLVYDHGGSDDRPPMFRVTVTFKEIRGQTHMDMTMALATAEAATETKKFIKKAGGNATWDRLAEFLHQDKKIFVINRSFEAPLEVVFDAWTDPDHVSKWLPPTGFTMSYQKADIRPSGKSSYVMTNGSNVTMYGQCDYLEITRPHRLVYTQNFCDENGKMSRHPHAPTWPATMLTTILFDYEEEEKTTRVTVTWEPYGPVTTEEVETFMNARDGMTMGWTGSFDKLEEYLKR